MILWPSVDSSVDSSVSSVPSLGVLRHRKDGVLHSVPHLRLVVAGGAGLRLVGDHLVGMLLLGDGLG